jgi:hypothetical protein
VINKTLVQDFLARAENSNNLEAKFTQAIRHEDPPNLRKDEDEVLIESVLKGMVDRSILQPQVLAPEGSGNSEGTFKQAKQHSASEEQNKEEEEEGEYGSCDRAANNLIEVINKVHSILH